MVLRSLCAALVLLAVSAAPAAADFTPGADGAGDPFYPNAGNGGYDVRHYSLKLDYEPQNEQLAGDVTISARATQDLSSFNLDLRGFKVQSVTVNGSAASFTRKGQELTITPSAGLRRNRDFSVRVVYDGHANYVLDPDKSKDGWIPTDDGAFVVNEPQGAPTWFPANDTPKDFATFEFAITVPEGRTAMANGRLVSTTDNGDTTTWRWREASPMVPYLDDRDQRRLRAPDGTLANGLPEYNAVDPQTRRFGQKEPEPQLAWDRLAGRRSRRSTCSSSSTARTRSTASARSSTGRPTSSTRSSRRRSRTTGTSRAMPRSSTRSRTSGSATPSCSSAGRTCG